ncbi:MAG TPA: putative zinc-binding peptidase [Polyangiales bacterium]|nr:putative zinc-binding peptidase [Polyangiales bacterium]
MRLFSCSACAQIVFFENVECTRCGHRLGYLPDHSLVSALEKDETVPAGDRGDQYEALTPAAEGSRYRACRNAVEFAACNWMIPASEPHTYCRACRLTSVMPDLEVPEALERWFKLEQAKRRLVCTLDQLSLPIESRAERPRDGLTFVFLSQGDLGREMVLTGHANGMVTINVNEADDPYREQVRKEMKEAYRTLLGHFRHEVGHYYWDRLIRDTEWLGPFRALFGDERQDYAEAAKRHYEKGPPPDWSRKHVSAYATMHPWEDWAETWSHYLHMFDTLDTGRAHSLVVQQRPEQALASPRVNLRELHDRDFPRVIDAWIKVTLTLNSLNRSMGLADPYPFILSAQAIKKLNFVHDVIDRWRLAKPDRKSVPWPDKVDAPARVIEKYEPE